MAINLRKARVVATLMVVALAAQSAWSAPAKVEGRLAEGIRLHDAARDDPASIGKAKEILGPLKDGSSLALGYYGSVVTMEADVASANKKMLKALALLKEGTGYIDEAIKLSPELIDLRFIRIETSYEISLSSPMNRFKEMKIDIEWLSARTSALDASERGVLELYRGLYLARAKKIDEALDAFDKCIEISPGSPEAAEAKKQIARYAE